MRHWLWLTIGGVGLCATSAWAQDADPFLVHAEGLEAELDQNIDVALKRLRMAHELAPEDETIAFDLARVAFENNVTSLASDAKPFLAQEPKTPDAFVLRAYILNALGRGKEAQQDVKKALVRRPQHQESLRLQALLQAREHAEAEKRRPKTKLSLGVRTALQYDTNVNVQPDFDDPESNVETSKQAGTRGQFDAWGALTHGALRAGGSFSFGPHLNNREGENGLAFYDAAAMGVYAGHLFQIGMLDLSGRLSGTHVRLDDFQANYMTSGTLRYDARFGPKRWGARGYASGSYRDFAKGEFNQEGDQGLQKFDRDGFLLEAGAGFVVNKRRVQFELTGGWAADVTEGNVFDSSGPAARARVSFTRGKTVVSARAGFEQRTYRKLASDSEESSDVVSSEQAGKTSQRIDNRIGFQLKAGYEVYEAMRVFLGAGFIKNDSRTKAYDYSRQVAQIGIEAFL